MKCPFCGSRRSNIKEKEKEPRHNYLMRDRVCRECGLTYSTYEVVVPATLMVEKSEVDPRTTEHVLEEFDRSKLIRGILLAFDRDKADENAIDIAGRVMRELIHSKEHVVRSTEIGNIVERALLESKETGAALRFAILHKSLQSIEAIEEWANLPSDAQPSRKLEAPPGPPDLCPYCASTDTLVITTRLSPDNTAQDSALFREFKAPPGEYVLRRRRECNDCRERYTSYEMTWATPPFMVVKTNGSQEPFDKGKLAISIQKAWGRPTIDEEITRITEDVTHDIARLLERRVDKTEVPSWQIGRAVLRHLADRGHEIALIRYMLRQRGLRDKDKDSPRDLEEIRAMIHEIKHTKLLLRRSR